MNTQTSLPSAQKFRFSPFRQRDELDIFAVLRTLWRGRWLVVLFMLVCFVLGGYYAYRIAQPSFSATAVIELKPRQSQILGLESVVSGSSVDTASLNTEIATLRSREMAETVVRRLELHEEARFEPSPTPAPTLKNRIKDMLGMLPPPPVWTEEQKAQIALQRATSFVRSSVSAQGQRETYLVLVSARASRPTTASALANALAEAYIDAQVEEKYDETEQAISWLSDRVRELETDLRERETRINDLQSDTDLVNRNALQSVLLQAKEFRDRIESRQETLITLQERLDQQEAALGSRDKAQILTAFEDTFLTRLGAQLGASLEGNETNREEFLARAEAVAERTRLSLTRVQDEIDALSQSLESIQSRIDEQSSDLRQLEQMERELAVSRDLYETFLTGLQEATVQVGLVRPDSRIMSRAVIPGAADSPQKPQILIMSLFLGFVIGLTVLLVREFLNNRIQNMDDLENLTELPVLGSVPSFPIRKRKELMGFLASNPTSSGVEALRNLRTSLLMQNLDQSPQVIMITSSVPGEGKTSLSLALAHNLVGLGKRVLLIEGDIRRRMLNNYLKLPQDTPGLLDITTGAVSMGDGILHEPTTGIDIIVGQKSSVNPADLFSSSAFKQLIDALRKEYDHILIDTPPVLVVPDARIIAPLTDSALYVVKWDSTTREQIRSGVKLFEAFSLRLTGFAITQVNTRRIRSYGYGDLYGAYSSYGKAYYDK